MGSAHLFWEESEQKKSFLHGLDARSKLIVFCAIAIGVVSCPPGSQRALTAYLFLLAALFLLARLPFRSVLRRALLIAPFLFLVALSLLANRGTTAEWSRLGEALAKSSLGAFSLILFSSTTPFPRLIEGLAVLRAPSLFISLSSFLVRYVFVLSEEVQRMRRSWQARSFPLRWAWENPRGMGQMLGTWFLRSYERGERVHVAMLARGYEGKMVLPSPARMRGRDFLFLGTILCMVLLVRIWG